MAASLTTKSDREKLVSINPADGSVVAAVRTTQAREIDAVVERARAAYRRSGWAQLRPDRKAGVMHEVARRLLAEKERLAILQMRDNGKPLAECRGMVGCGRRRLPLLRRRDARRSRPNGHAAARRLRLDDACTSRSAWWRRSRRGTRRSTIEAQKVAPALAAGNAVILKPVRGHPARWRSNSARICARRRPAARDRCSVRAGHRRR